MSFRNIRHFRFGTCFAVGLHTNGKRNDTFIYNHAPALLRLCVAVYYVFNGYVKVLG